MAKIRFELEVEVMWVYTVPVFADNLEDAAKQVGNRLTANDIEKNGDKQDHEINVVGISRQIGRKMYQ